MNEEFLFWQLECAPDCEPVITIKKLNEDDTEELIFMIQLKDLKQTLTLLRQDLI